MSLYMVKKSIFDASNGSSWCTELVYRNNTEILGKDGEPDEKLVKAADDQLEKYFRENLREIFKKGRAYIRLSPAMLSRNVADVLTRERTIIEVTPEILADKTGLSKTMQLKKLGYIISLYPFLYRDDHKELFKFVDIVRFSINSDAAAIDLTVKKCREYGKLSIACDVETSDQHEFAKSVGVNLISGFYFAKPALETKKSGGPMIKTFLQILAMLYSRDPDLEQIAAIISTDPVLTIRLLRLINQLCADTGNTVSTVQQALVLLGLDKLKEWIYLVGLQRLNRDAPTELLRMALFRASFCETLGRVTPGVGSRTKELYLMGLISIITGTSGKQLAEALEQLPVSTEIKSGLMGGGGIFSDIYYIAYNYERANWDKVDFYLSRCKIEKDALTMVYLTAAHFVEGFTLIK